MYNEDKNERNYFFRNLVVKILLILLFVFLLMWLFPMPNLNPFYDRIFTENMSNMTNAAKGYFTTSRLPEKEGEKKVLTLKEMVDNKMLVNFTDSDGKTCDLEKSYVEVTKKDGEYIFKTNLVCGSKEDYVIEYFGCYDVCKDGSCEVKNDDNKNSGTTIEKIEYRFYKITTEKLIDKYVCKDGYTLKGTKCVSKNTTSTSVDATKTCPKGYTYNKEINKCEKTNIEKNDATKVCASGYIYATSMGKCIKLDNSITDAKVTYSCAKGTLSGTKCIIEENSVVDAKETYSCENGTLNGTKCMITSNAKATYSCAKGTLSGTKCVISTTTTTDPVCNYTNWDCSQTESKNTMNTGSTETSTVRYLYQNNRGKYVYEVCTRKYLCSGGKTYTETTTVDAKVTYSCAKGTLSGTKCIENVDATKNYKCENGTLNGTKCTIKGKSTIDATKNYKCENGTLNGTKCTIKEKSTIDATKNYKCANGTLEGTKCVTSDVITKDPTYKCRIGVLDGNKCIITTVSRKDVTYECEKGYTKAGNSCYKTIESEDIYNAEAIYKTVTNKVYKWSSEKEIKGWTRTGETRTVKVNVTSK